MHRWLIYLFALGTFLTGTVALVISGIVDVIAADLNISVAVAGQMVTVYSLAYAIGAPLAILYTSSWSRKKVLLAALALFVVGNLITIVSTQFGLMLVARAVLGVASGVYTIVALSAAARLVEPQKVGSAISVILMGTSSSLVFGVPLGTTIAQWMNWRWIFALLVVIALVIMLAIAKWVPPMEGRVTNMWKQAEALFKNGVVVSGLLVTLFWMTGYFIVYTYLTPFLKHDVHLHATTVTLILLILGLFSMLGTRFGGYTADRLGTERTLLICLTIHALALLSLPLLTNSWLATIGSMVIWVSAAWMTGPTMQTYFVQRVPQATDLALSLNSSVMQLGTALGAGLGGMVVSSTASSGYNPWVGGGMLLLGLLAAILSLALSRYVRTKQG
jgi:DHA1 family putative efflux transporter-like MFS transporter